MKITMFYHSLYSDWNHGNAHFLRGILKELIRRNHDVKVYEPAGGWSLNNLIKDHGAEMLDEFSHYYPTLRAEFYDPKKDVNFYNILKDEDLVIVHEWNDPKLVTAIGEVKKNCHFKLLFHDTHHRAASDPESMSQYDFSNYDGALVFGKVIEEIYQKKNWINKVWTWHEAADVKLFAPKENVEKEGDVVWIGNWGDDERAEELMEFFVTPVMELGISAKVYGVRYPESALQALKEANIEYGGWLPNYKVPEVFAKYRFTIHIPRRPYAKMLPGIPTIRPFEAMSCGIPLICAPWEDSEDLFHPEFDYLKAANGKEMKEKMQEILNDDHLAQSLAKHGRNTIVENHTCAHRVDRLEDILAELGLNPSIIHSENKEYE